MYTVSAEYKELANASARNVKVKVNVKEKILTDGTYTWQLRNTYFSTDKVIGLKIIEGQTTGAFRLGDTICPVLELKLSSDSVVLNNDLIEVLVSFDNGAEWQLLTSDFFVDSIDRQRQIVSVRALGTMIIVAKSYNSKLTFPTTTENVLSEMLDINAIGAGYTLLSNATISEKPVKGEAEDGSTLYYTRREMYGFLAAANGGSAYINNRNQLCFSTPRETGETFTHEQVLSETIGSERVVSSIQWNTSGLSYSLGDDYNEDTIEFFNPLVFSGNEQILHGLEETLIGLDFDGAIVKKNGCGYFELGDIVTYTDINDNAHRLLIMGIVYDFSDGYFSETLYSLTNSKNQRQYAGQEVVSNQIGGGQAQTVKDTVKYLNYSADTITKQHGLSWMGDGLRIVGDGLFSDVSFISFGLSPSDGFTLKLNGNTLTYGNGAFNFQAVDGHTIDFLLNSGQLYLDGIDTLTIGTDGLHIGSDGYLYYGSRRLKFADEEESE